MSWTLPEILAATGGELLRWGPGPFRGFSTDTRQTNAGEAFLALRGPRFDGHDFVALALDRGATAAVVDRNVSLPRGLAGIRVGDGLRALGDLAAAKRRTLPLRVVGVTARIQFDPSAPDGTPRKLMDSRRLLGMGWKPAIDQEQGLRTLYEWCLETQVFDRPMARPAPVDLASLMRSPPG